MQKVISLIVIVLLSYTAQAQLGIHVGGNTSFVKRSASHSGRVDIEGGVAGGFQLGVSYDIGRVFIFQPALFIQQKGANATAFYHSDQYRIQVRSNLNYLEIPLNIMVKLKITDQAKIYFGAGITGAMLLWSKYSSKDPENSWEEGETNSAFTQFTDNDFDFGVQGFVGFQLYRFTATLTYNNSFLKGVRVASSDEKNRYLSLNLGYRIGRDKEKKKE